MKLTGPGINKAIMDRRFSVTPYDPACIGPTSIDLKLGAEMKTHRLAPFTGEFDVDAFLDMRRAPEYDLIPIQRWKGNPCFFLTPGRVYLAPTVERVRLDGLSGVLFGRSTSARYTMTVESAGFVDDGFEGHLVLEIQVVRPLIVYIGDRICQLALEPVMGERMPYGLRGHYQGQAGARGPEPMDRFGHGDLRPVRTPVAPEDNG